ncbi:DUF4232 domain-containing protein [Corynebacterium neomassiliense]|uniref:DUF4232 domain-containing protein n=1 Tax=Corynebacterium neomassiliense TaxID=2079482 RepID=UPI001030858A|nr:DUF4232 domain-containing protein [Corynebacterium neomassiliense]
MGTRTPGRTRRTAATITAALALVTLGACGSSTGDGSTATSAATGVTGADTTPTGTITGPGTTATANDTGDGAQGGDAGQRCGTDDLTVEAGPGDGAAGSVYRPLEFTNVSDSPCILSGYPGVSLVSGDAQVGQAAERESAAGDLPVVTLAPGDSASADLKITAPGVYGDRCTETPAEALKVYPPEQTVSVTVAAEGLTGCTGEDAPATLSISPIR